MNSGLQLALFVAFMVLWIWLARRLAIRRDRSTIARMWLAALFGPFAVVVLALLPARPPDA
jgi:hypothetical protein